MIDIQQFGASMQGAHVVLFLTVHLKFIWSLNAWRFRNKKIYSDL